jgi:Glycosyltransferases, probably involved in cell wall biogenesis
MTIMTEFKISIIVPCYNKEQYVRQCIESVIHQTIGFANIQLIIINDASSDLSGEYISQYAEQYPNNIVYICLEENVGQANARNIGIERVNAPYLMFLDSDDWLAEDYCESMLAPTFKTECDLVQCGYIEYRKDGTKVNRENSIRNHSKLVSLKKVDDRKKYLANNNLAGVIGRSVYRTAWLNEHNIRFVKFNKYEDNYFAGIVNYSIGTIYIVPKCLYYYRILEKSNFHSRNDKDHFERLRLNIVLIDYYKETRLWDQYYENIRDSFLDGFYINTLHIIFCQFDGIPIDQIKYMQKTVKELFPDYLETIIKPEQEMMQELLLTVEFDHFTVDDWRQMAKYYRAYRGGITSAFDFLLCILWRNWSILQINKQ